MNTVMLDMVDHIVQQEVDRMRAAFAEGGAMDSEFLRAELVMHGHTFRSGILAGLQLAEKIASENARTYR